MSGAGFTQAMINSLKFNKRERKRMFDKEGAKDFGGLGSLGEQKKMSPQAFQAFKNSLEVKRKKEERRHRGIMALTVLITLTLVISFLWWWNS